MVNSKQSDSMINGATSDDYTLVGVEDMLWQALAWTLFWVVFFYLLARTERRWAGFLPPSSKPHENDRYWIARNVIGSLHALVIAVITVPSYFMLAAASTEARFGTTTNVARCSIGPDNPLAEFGATYQAVALAGMAFTTFTIADVFISGAHGLATWDYVVHHVAFITAGIIIRSHCMLPYNASILLAMEVSTPFLNVMLLLRHRGEAYTPIVQVCGSIFFLLFVVFRLILNTYGAVVLWLGRDEMTPEGFVPTWQIWFLLVAVTAGAVVQFFWFPTIFKSFSGGIRALLGGSNAAPAPHGDEESKEESESSALSTSYDSENSGALSPDYDYEGLKDGHEANVIQHEGVP